MLLFVNADFNLLLLAFFLYGLGNTTHLTSYQVLLGEMTGVTISRFHNIQGFRIKSQGNMKTVIDRHLGLKTIVERS